jgi:polyisoprenoid-binding protein YceI
MRNAVAALAAGLVLFAPCGYARAAGDVTHLLDPAQSKATFSVQHVFVERVQGTVPIASGTVVLAPDTVIPSSVTAELAPGKIHSGDDDRDGALRSPDFFDVKDFPRWTFESTKITPLSATSFGVDGTLTIRGKPQPEHLTVTVRGDAAHPLYHAVGHIDRKAFQLPVTRLDPVIGTIVDVTLDIVTK